jgi:predicted HicB family RNase H-like nuclease
MTTMLEYRGYLGSVEYSDEDEVFHGRLEFIRDLVTYEGTDAQGLKQAFHAAVDDSSRSARSRAARRTRRSRAASTCARDANCTGAPCSSREAGA